MAFLWSEDCAKDFEDIKNTICDPIGVKPFTKDRDMEIFIGYLGLRMGLTIKQKNPKKPEQNQLI